MRLKECSVWHERDCPWIAENSMLIDVTAGA